jgi:hypothetical protein
MNNKKALVTTVAGLAFSLLSSSGSAHHSFAAQFDADKPIKLTGTITNVEWRNPHAWFYLDVNDEGGDVSNWGMELASPNLLVRKGWARSFMKIGDAITVEGFHARDGSNTGNARTVTNNSSGKTMTMESDYSSSDR